MTQRMYSHATHLLGLAALAALSACQIPAQPMSQPGTAIAPLGTAPQQAAHPFVELTGFKIQGIDQGQLGQLQMQIDWPEPDFSLQAIPSSTTQLRISLSAPGQADLVQTVMRPIGSAISSYRLIFLTLPAGSGRTIRVEALDSGGRLVANGTAANVTIQANVFNRQRITLSPVSSPMPTPTPTSRPGGGGGGGGGGGTPVNRPPQVSAINLAPTLVGAGYTVAASAVASDPENRPLSYAWTASAGSFDNPSAASPVWTGPVGTHSFSVTVSDGVNSTPLSRSLTLSANQPPQTSGIEAALTRSGNTYSGSLSVSASDPEQQPLSYTWTASAGTISGSGANVSWSGPPGTHSFSVAISDGTNSTPVVREISLLPNLPPEIPPFQASFSLDGNGYSGTLSASATDPEGESLSYHWSADAGSFSLPDSPNTSWSGPAGARTFTLSVSDGTTSVPVTRQIVLSANQAPSVSAINPSLSLNGAGYSGSLSAVASDPESQSLSYAWSASAGTFTSNGGATANWNGPAGTHTFNVSVSDGTNSTPYSRTLTLAQNQAPSVSAIQHSLTLSGQQYSGGLSVTASDPENQPLSYVWTASAGTFNNSTLASPTWTGPAGTHTFSVNVSDGVNSSPFSREIQLSAPNRPPVIGELQANMSFVGTRHQGSLSASGVSDPDGDTLSYSWSVPPVAGSLGQATQPTALWTQAPSGRHLVALTVSDGQLSTTKTLEVNLSNQLPLIQDIDLSGLSESALGVHSGPLVVSAVDPEGATLSYAWSISGGSLQPPANGATVSWNSGAQAAVNQQYTATVTVSDGEASQSFSKIFTRHNNQAPQITGLQQSLNETAFNQFGGSLTATASDAENDLLVYEWDDPSQILSNPGTTNTVSLKAGTPGGSYLVRVRAYDGRQYSAWSSTTLVLASNNLPPVISSLSKNISYANGSHSGSLSAVVSDPEGRPLSYSWSLVPPVTGASLSNASTATPGFSGPAGTYTVRLSVSDTSASPAQTVSQDLSFTLTNPNLAPSVSQIGLSNQTYSNGQHAVQLTASGSDPESQPLSYTWSTTGGNLSATVGNPVTLTAPAGTYTVSVRANDGSNLSQPFSRQVTFTNPNRAPVVTGVTPSLSLSNGQYSGSLSVAATDADGDSLSYSWEVIEGGGQLTASTGQSVGLTAGPGTHRIRVVASDGQTSSAPYDFVTTLQSNQAPTIAEIEVGADVWASTLWQRNLTALASDPEGNALSYNWSVISPDPGGTHFYRALSPGSFQFDNTFDATSRSVGFRGSPSQVYVVQVQVSDGTSSRSYQRSVLLNNNPPRLSSLSYSFACAGGGVTSVPVSISVYDPDGHPIRSVDWSVSAGSLSTGTRDQKTWSIPSAGSYKLTIKSADDYGSSTAELNVSVGGCP